MPRAGRAERPEDPSSPDPDPRGPAPRPLSRPVLEHSVPMTRPVDERASPLAPMRDGPPGADGFDRGATAPQLRRFIKSRAYVPMHELRRRFGIDGGDDVVTPVELEAERVYVGLPSREGRLLADLLRQGDIGYELSLDPIAPIVVGVYPMRPVPRG